MKMTLRDHTLDKVFVEYRDGYTVQEALMWAFSTCLLSWQPFTAEDAATVKSVTRTASEIPYGYFGVTLVRFEIIAWYESNEQKYTLTLEA